MFNPSPGTTVVVPYRVGPGERVGASGQRCYFGKVPRERLVARDGVIYFKGDGRFRSKIGLSPQRAKPVLGSYNALEKLLTLVQFQPTAGHHGLREFHVGNCRRNRSVATW
jgi:hypothetical protein